VKKKKSWDCLAEFSGSAAHVCDFQPGARTIPQCVGNAAVMVGEPTVSALLKVGKAVVLVPAIIVLGSAMIIAWPARALHRRLAKSHAQSELSHYEYGGVMKAGADVYLPRHSTAELSALASHSRGRWGLVVDGDESARCYMSYDVLFDGRAILRWHCHARGEPCGLTVPHGALVVHVEDAAVQAAPEVVVHQVRLAVDSRVGWRSQHARAGPVAAAAATGPAGLAGTITYV